MWGGRETNNSIDSGANYYEKNTVLLLDISFHVSGYRLAMSLVRNMTLHIMPPVGRGPQELEEKTEGGVSDSTITGGQV